MITRVRDSLCPTTSLSSTPVSGSPLTLLQPHQEPTASWNSLSALLPKDACSGSSLWQNAVSSLSTQLILLTPTSPSAGGQREELRPWQRSWGRRLGIPKGVIKPQETPCSWASTPKPESVLCSHLHLWLYGGLSPITVSLREGVNVQLQGNKNSWVWQECFSSNLLWRLSSLPV